MAEQTKKCPFCAEEILAEAIKCKHCGEMLAKKEEPPNQSGGNSGVKTLGAIVLVAGLVVGFYYWQFYDASVEVPRQEIFGQVIGGGRVNNLGLLQAKQTGTFLGFGAAALGLVLVLVGANIKSASKTTNQEAPGSRWECPRCLRENPPTVNRCGYCGCDQEGRKAPTVQAPTVYEARPFEGEVRKLKISCPECKHSEEVTSDKLYDTAQYRSFSAYVNSAACKITLKCKNCGKQFNYNKLEVTDDSLG